MKYKHTLRQETSNVADASYGADVTGKLAARGIDMDILSYNTKTRSRYSKLQATVVFNSATVAGLDHETVGLDNIENAQGVNVTGKVAAP